jgi:Amt family ammonium transporter
MNVMAWAIFVPLWITFSYCPVAFSLWGGGFLERLGVIDYAGGFAIHVSSGTAGFIAAAIVGPRHKVDLKDHRPSNLGFCVIGAG